MLLTVSAVINTEDKVKSEKAPSVFSLVSYVVILYVNITEK